MQKIFVPEIVLKKEAKFIKKNSNIPYTKILDILITELGFIHYNEYKDFINKKIQFYPKNINKLDIFHLFQIKTNYLNTLKKLKSNIYTIHFIDKIIEEKKTVFFKSKEPYMLSTYLILYPILFNVDFEIINKDFSINEIGLNFFISDLLNRYKNISFTTKEYENIIINRRKETHDDIDNNCQEILFSLNNKHNIKTFSDFLLSIIYKYKKEKLSFSDISKLITAKITEEYLFLKQYKIDKVQIPQFNIKNSDPLIHPLFKSSNKNQFYLGYNTIENKNLIFSKKEQEIISSNIYEPLNIFSNGSIGSGLTMSLKSILAHYIINNSGFILFDSILDTSFIYHMFDVASINNRKNEIIIIKDNLNEVSKEMIKSFIINKRMVVFSIDIYKNQDNIYLFENVYKNFILALKEISRKDFLYNLGNYPYSIIFQHIELFHSTNIISSLIENFDYINSKNINIISTESNYKSITDKELVLKFNNILIYKQEELENFSKFALNELNPDLLPINLKDFLYLTPGEFFYIKNRKFYNKNTYKSFYFDSLNEEEIFYINLS